MSDATTETAITFEDVVHARHSVRGYLDKPVPPEVLERIFTLAQQTPSNCNVQPWQCFVASGETRDRIRRRFMDNVKNGVPPNRDYESHGRFQGEYRRRQIECAVAMYKTLGIARDDSAGRARAALRNYELFDAPHVVFIGMHKDLGTSVILDVGMYTEALMLAMTANGVSSVAQGCMRDYPDVVREEFGTGDEFGIVFGLSFGYEDLSAPVNATRTTREPISASVVFGD